MYDTFGIYRHIIYSDLLFKSSIFMRISKKDSYKKKFTQLYNSVIYKYISEKDYIKELQELNSKGFKTYHINTIIDMLTNMQKNELLHAYKITHIIHTRDLLYKDISSFALEFDDIGNIFSSKKTNIIERMHLITDILATKQLCINAFKKIESPSPSQSPSQSQSPLSSSVLVNSDSSYSRDNNNALCKSIKSDIINRLHQLLQKHYSLRQLKFMNIQLKLSTDIDNMSCMDLFLYYTYVIEKISNELMRWKYLCSQYIATERNYINYYL